MSILFSIRVSSIPLFLAGRTRQQGPNVWILIGHIKLAAPMSKQIP